LEPLAPTEFIRGTPRLGATDTPSILQHYHGGQYYINLLWTDAMEAS